MKLKKSHNPRTDHTSIYLVRCLKCGNEQKISTKKMYPFGIRKDCVYCGKRFIIHSSPNKSAIIRRLR